MAKYVRKIIANKQKITKMPGQVKCQWPGIILDVLWHIDVDYGLPVIHFNWKHFCIFVIMKF